MNAEVKTVYVIENILNPKATKVKQRYVLDKTFKKAIENESENVIPLFTNNDLAHFEYVPKAIIFAEKPTDRQIERTRILETKRFALEQIKILTKDITNDQISLKYHNDKIKGINVFKKDCEERIKKAKAQIAELKKKNHLKV